MQTRSSPCSKLSSQIPITPERKTLQFLSHRLNPLPLADLVLLELVPWTRNEHVSQVQPRGTPDFPMLCLCSSCFLYLDPSPAGPTLPKPSLITALMPNDLTH